MMCELYKDQNITIKIKDNIYYGPIKRMYQTFHDTTVKVFHDGKWYSAHIIGKPSEKEIYCINKTLYCSNNLLLSKTFSNKSLSHYDKTPVSNLKIGDTIEVNTWFSIPDKKIESFDSDEKYTIESIEKTDIVSDWLFGVSFLDYDSHEYYTLTNGIVVATMIPRF